MQGLRNEAEKVPKRIGILHVRLRIALLGVDEVRKLQSVADEEDGRVVAHHVPIALLRVELEGESTGIPRRIGKPRLPCHGGESGEHRRPLPDRTKEPRLAKIRHVPARENNQLISILFKFSLKFKSPSTGVVYETITYLVTSK